LNLYGFCRLTRGADSGGYYHELFLRGKPFLCKRMIRTKVKGTKFKAASSPDQEPDFYTMPSVVVTPAHSRHSSPQHQPFVSSDESSSGSVAPAPMAPSHDFANMFSNSLQQQNQQQQLSFEPFPFQQQQQQFVPQMQMPVAFAPPVSNPADQVLDDAVNELFLNTNNMASEMNDLDDFVRDWEPDNFARSLDNDVALGFMLDKLLED